MKMSYPVIFTETEKAILVEIPDFVILTEGKDIGNAVDMARDAIYTAIASKIIHNDLIPTPRKIDEIIIENGTFYNEGNSNISMIDVDVKRRACYESYTRKNS